MEDVRVKVVVETQEASSNVDTLNGKLDETATKVENVNDAAEGASVSIGSFGGAFEGAFKAVENATKGVGGAVGNTVQSIKQAIPVVKNINSTAIKGLTGIKGAIAATGIGALIIAITTITTHWEGFSKAVGLSEEKFKKFKETVINVLANIVSGVVGVGNVVLQYLLTPIRTVIEAFKGLGNIIKDIFTGNWSDVKKHATEAAQGIGNAFRKGFNISENFQAGKAAGEKFVEGVKTTLTYKKPEVEEAATEVGTAAGKKFSEAAQNEIEKQAGKIVDAFKKSQEGALKVLDKTYKEALSLLETERVKDLWEGIPDSVAKSIAKLRGEVNDEVKELDEGIQGIQDFLVSISSLKDSPLESDQELYKSVSDQYLKRLEQYQTARKLLISQGQDEEKELILKWLKEVADLEIKENENKLKQKKDLINQEIRYYQEAVQSIASIFGSLAVIEEERINRLVKSGKITEEEAEKQFETVKAWQYAETWINTLAGMTAALTSPIMQAAGPPGWIAAAVQAAALLASGIAQTVKIKNTQFGSTSGIGGGGDAALVGATPLNVMNDLTPTATMNVPVSSENSRVYILESDIQKSNNRVKVRESETTW